MALPAKPATDSAAGLTLSPRQIWIIRATLLAFVVAVFALIFAVPRTPQPPPSPAQPDQAFVDRIGLVRPAFAREWAGGLLNDPRAEIVVYVDARPPEGNLAQWTTNSASEWKVGSAKNDTGLVLFVFKEPRIARIEVGYGLEGTFTDARARQLLEAQLVPHFARGDYERGFDAIIKAMREELGGDASFAQALVAAVQVKDPPMTAQLIAAFTRLPRMPSVIVRSYLEEDPGPRFVILVFTVLSLGVVVMGLGSAFTVVWRLATLPGKLRARKSRSLSGPEAAMRLADDLKLGEIIAGVAGSIFSVVVIGLILLTTESFMTRRGNFSGAGAEIVWPAPP